MQQRTFFLWGMCRKPKVIVIFCTSPLAKLEVVVLSWQLTFTKLEIFGIFCKTSFECGPSSTKPEVLVIS
jgi:hypothetical protein